MTETGRAVQQYQKIFEAERGFLLKKYTSTQHNVTSRESVRTTWEISFKQVERHHPEATNLLLMFSLLHHDEIPSEMLESYFGGEKYFNLFGGLETVLENDGWILHCLRTALVRKTDLVEALSALRKYSFVHLKASSSVMHVHPRVHSGRQNVWIPSHYSRTNSPTVFCGC
jgi:hypothetical protein